MRGRPLKPEQKKLATAMLLAGLSYRQIKRTMSISLGSIHNIARELKENENLERISFSKLEQKHALAEVLSQS